jgi:hypothetical protein
MDAVPRHLKRAVRCGIAAAVASGLATAAAAVDGQATRKLPPLVIAEQGSFAVGGTVLTAPGTYDPVPFNAPAGQTFHGGHAYVQYQIPPNARRLPLVLWHGGGQMGKCWESTPDGRDKGKGNRS